METHNCFWLKVDQPFVNFCGAFRGAHDIAQAHQSDRTAGHFFCVKFLPVFPSAKK
jgi:hypothetical protein